MHKAPKIILITAASLIGTGTLLAGGAWACAGFDASRLSTTSHDWHQTVRALEVESTTPHQRIIVTSDFDNVRIEAAHGDAIELEYWTGNTQDVEVSDEDGTLALDVSAKTMDGVMIDLSPTEAGGTEDTATVVRVPSSFNGEIEVHSDSGEVFAENVHELAGLHASSVDGSVVINNVSATKLDAINENGDTLLSSIEAGAILATSHNGDISLGGAVARKAEVVNGSGEIILVNISLEETLACRSVNGDISARRLDIAASSVENVNGDIYLSYLGNEADYHIDTRSNLGDIDAPRGGSETVARTIDVGSDLGDIQINFNSR